MKHTKCEDCKLRKGDCGYHAKKDNGQTNNNIASLSACDQYGNCMFFKPKEKLQGDLISREELKQHKFLIPDIQFVGGRNNGKTIERITLAYNKGWNAAIDAIYENAPAVPNEYMRGYEAAEREYKRPTGKWIKSIDILTDRDGFTCSRCRMSNTIDKPYCPNCGAKMKEEENEIDN